MDNKFNCINCKNLTIVRTVFRSFSRNSLWLILSTVLLTGLSTGFSTLSLATTATATTAATTVEPETEFLSPDKAFILNGTHNGNNKENPTESKQAKLSIQIAPGYQLYQDHIKFSDLNDQPIPDKTLILPAAIQKQDEVLGQKNVYRKNLEINVPLVKGPGNELGIKIQYQGCAEAGFCYPPISKKIVLAKNGVITVTDLSPEEFNQNLSAQAASTGRENSIAALTDEAKDKTKTDDKVKKDDKAKTENKVKDKTKDNPKASSTPPQRKSREAVGESETDRIAGLFQDKNLALTLLAFLGLGLLLSFTPCVLPMVPILANILIGQNQPLSRKRSLTLSAIYIFSMATCYALAGVAAGLLGSHLSTTLQQPLVLISLSFLLLLFSLSQLNLIQVQMPAFLSQAFSGLESKSQSQGSAIGAMTMGAISALVASPCVTPALLGALTYISQTGNAGLGGLALFSLAFGMGLPLLVAASIGSHFLPKVGSWMVYIKYVTGILLLILAGSILLRAVPLSESDFDASSSAPTSASTTVSSFSGSSGAAMGAASGSAATDSIATSAISSSSSTPTSTSTSTASSTSASTASSASSSTFASTSSTTPSATSNASGSVAPGPAFKTASGPVFKSVKSPTELSQALAMARAENKPVLLDVSASWCVSCRQMDKEIFENNAIHDKLKQVQLLKLDLSRQTKDTEALQKELKIIGPPMVIFFWPDGQEAKSFRLAGKPKFSNFDNLLTQFLQETKEK